MDIIQSKLVNRPSKTDNKFIDDKPKKKTFFPFSRRSFIESNTPKLSDLWGNNYMPKSLQSCIAYIFHYHLDTPHLFRKNGNKLSQEVLLTNLRKNSDDIPTFYSNMAFDVCSSLKFYISEIPGGLLQKEFQSDWLKLLKVTDRNKWFDKIQNILRKLSVTNKMLLYYMLVLAHGVSEHSEINSMSYKNLSIVYAPSIFSHVIDIQNMKALAASHELMAWMISSSKLLMSVEVFDKITKRLNKVGSSLRIIPYNLNAAENYYKNGQAVIPIDTDDVNSTIAVNSVISRDSGLESTDDDLDDNKSNLKKSSYNSKSIENLLLANTPLTPTVSSMSCSSAASREYLMPPHLTRSSTVIPAVCAEDKETQTSTPLNTSFCPSPRPLINYPTYNYHKYSYPKDERLNDFIRPLSECFRDSEMDNIASNAYDMSHHPVYPSQDPSSSPLCRRVIRPEFTDISAIMENKYNNAPPIIKNPSFQSGFKHSIKTTDNPVINKGQILKRSSCLAVPYRNLPITYPSTPFPYLQRNQPNETAHSKHCSITQLDSPPRIESNHPQILIPSGKENKSNILRRHTYSSTLNRKDSFQTTIKRSLYKQIKRQGNCEDVNENEHPGCNYAVIHKEADQENVVVVSKLMNINLGGSKDLNDQTAKIDYDNDQLCPLRNDVVRHSISLKRQKPVKSNIALKSSASVSSKGSLMHRHSSIKKRVEFQ